MTPDDSKAKAKRNRDNWKKRCIIAEAELEAWKLWGRKIDKWHTGLCVMIGVEPTHPAIVKEESAPSATSQRQVY